MKRIKRNQRKQTQKDYSLPCNKQVVEEVGKGLLTYKRSKEVRYPGQKYCFDMVEKTW